MRPNLWFNQVPVLMRKNPPLDLRTTPGAWQVKCQIGNFNISGFYTRVDQSCIFWGLISAVIFLTAQFSLLDWNIQAILSSILGLFGIIYMVNLTWYWVIQQQFTAVLYTWIFLIFIGLLITDLSIFMGWGAILIYLCYLWLFLSSIGYFCTAILMRSRAFILICLIHILGICILPYVGIWQFLTTGFLMGGSVMLLAEFRWDMYNLNG